MPELASLPGEVDDLITDLAGVAGAKLVDGRTFGAGAVVLTTGTFLRGLIHIGDQRTPAGRVGEAPALGLSAALERIGFSLGRLETGTPPRLDGRTIDWSGLEMQPGDDPPEPFSALTTRIENPQIECAITRTTEATHAIIRANVHRSPMYSGQIESRGPRYCPSVEDKIVRFGERDGHQVFLEPEGLTTIVYPTASRRRSLRTSSVPLRGDDSGAGARHDHPTRLCHRIRPRRSPRAAADARNQAPSRALSGGRSTEPPVTRGAAGQGLVAGLNAAARATGLPESCSIARKRIWGS